MNSGKTNLNPEEEPMTTEVVVKANHGWPVTVMQVDPKTAEAIGLPQTVEAGSERTFHIHSGADLHVHEVQPDEAK